MHGTLIRTRMTRRFTRGYLILDGFVRPTLELPWLDNAKNISCIPTGRYRCEIKRSPRFGLVYEVQEVPGRTDILFHVANRTRDLKGCIALGSRRGRLSGDEAVLLSSDALTDIRKHTVGSPFWLRVIETVDPFSLQKKGE